MGDKMFHDNRIDDMLKCSLEKKLVCNLMVATNEWSPFLIKTHNSESRGQEEASRTSTNE